MSDSVKTNGKLNGIGEKTPFLIGVAGGTASGKVTSSTNLKLTAWLEWNVMLEYGMQKDNGKTGASRYGPCSKTSCLHFARQLL